MDLHLLLNECNQPYKKFVSVPNLQIQNPTKPFLPLPILPKFITVKKKLNSRRPATFESFYYPSYQRTAPIISAPYFNPAYRHEEARKMAFGEERKKSRSKLAEHVLATFKREFNENMFPTSKKRDQMSKELGVPAKMIQSSHSHFIWIIFRLVSKQSTIF